jgi:hypothetical protein
MKLMSNKIRLMEALGIVIGITSSVAGLSATAASADSTASNSQSSSSIAQSVVRADKLEAIAKVLNMTTPQVQAYLQAHDLKQALADEGLSMQASRQAVLAQLQSELQTQGYSHAQISAALQAHQQHGQSNRKL